MSNEELADVLTRIADLLEIKGEILYKFLAYRKAADSLRNLAENADTLYRQGRLTEIPGVGKAISEKIGELLDTGKLEFLQRLESEVPPSLVDLLEVPDVGPKKAALFWKQAGITTLAELESAARAGSLRQLPGLGERSEARILAGIEALARRGKRLLLGTARPRSAGSSACAACRVWRRWKPPAACAAGAPPSATWTWWRPAATLPR
jgi:DNA polymerase (family 10)